MFDHLYTRAYYGLKDLRAFLGHLVKWTAIGSLVGLLCGTASALFLKGLELVTQTRLANPALILFLPVAGLVIGFIYARYAGSAARGSNLIIDELHTNADRIPFRMAPLILIGTWLSHLFGGSVGREGTAVQMGASLADDVRRVLGLNRADRRLILMAGISGGFGSVFGTPVAGIVFGMEVQSAGRMNYDGIVPCIAAACVGDIVARGWGIRHTRLPLIAPLSDDPTLLLKVILAGVAFGLAGLLFIELEHFIKFLFKRLRWPYSLKVAGGGVLVLLLTALVGTTDYLGLSTPLADAALSGAGVPPTVWILKITFTALTLGAGFVGGEVTPLFVTGATLGYTLSGILGLPPTLAAALGFVAVFAGASNTPIACTLMSVELFGGGPLLYMGVACVIAYLSSGSRSIYAAQRVGVVVGPPRDGVSMAELDERRQRARVTLK